MTTAALCPLSIQTLVDRNGAPMAGATLAFFDAGTTTPRTTYSDGGLTNQNTSPVRSDGFGRVPPIFLDVGSYRVVARAPDGRVFYAVDGLPGGTPTAAGVAPTALVIPPGFIMAGYTSDAIEGWVFANGRTIGNGSSGATARASADALPLYSVLWNANASLPVVGGRGASALVDFNAGKTIGLPDFRGRVLFGRDAMGNGDAGVITGTTTTAVDDVGAYFGTEAVTLSGGQIPNHSHSVSVGAAGGHTPAGTLDAQGLHTHTGGTDTAGDHGHPYNGYTVGPSAATGTTQNIPTSTLLTTGPAGSHAHNITINTAGLHMHGFTGAAVSDHVHPASGGSFGGGGSHTNVPPGVMVTWYIKL